MKDIVQWSAPSPLWAGITGSDETVVREAMLQPAILRFATDSFMEDFMSLMQIDPARLGDFLALPETWRGPLARTAPVSTVPPFLLKNARSRFLPTRTRQELMRISAGPLEATLKGETVQGQTAAPLKLYQPAHQRYYIVAGCLVCRQAGLPDHAVNGNRQERVTFVVRRLRERPGGRPTKSYDEYAFITTPGNKGWQKLEGSGEQLVKDEEQLPLSPTNFADTDQRQRRLLNGLIPVSKREAYMGAPVAAPPGTNGESATNVLPKTARKIMFRKLIGEPWKRVIDRSFAVTKALVGGKDPEKRDQLKEAREQLQVSSWYVLLDLAKFLNEHLREVWLVVLGQAPENTLNNAQRKLFDALNGTRADATLVNALKSTVNDPSVYNAQSVKPTLREALKAIKNPADDWEDRLDKVTTAYLRDNNTLAAAWPPFLFPLADPEPGVISPQISNSVPPLGAADQVEGEIDEPGVQDAAKQLVQAGVDRLTALVVRALPVNSPTLLPDPPLASQKLMQNGEGLFVIRFVYERPLCGPLEPPEVSKPTVQFEMAGYFDPDAPARPIRISLPLDTSPAGLRKFDKNTAFAISDVLCGQMQRLRSLTFGDLVLSVLPWPFHKSLSTSAPDAGACKSGGLEIGMICSISIPIITICALLLLIIIVTLLDIVFRWMPYFFICFPVPGLKGKK